MRNLGNQIIDILDRIPDLCAVTLRFKDGFEGTVVLDQLFDSGEGLAAEIISRDLFQSCFVQKGALAWPNGLELCPDAIRQWIEEPERPRAA